MLSVETNSVLRAAGSTSADRQGIRASGEADRAACDCPACADKTSPRGAGIPYSGAADGSGASRPLVSYFTALDKSHSAVVVGPQAETLLGFSPDEWYADPQLWLRQVHPEDRDRLLASYERVCNEGGWFTEEYRVLSRSGETLWLRNFIKMLKDEHGRPVGQEVAMWDITASKRAPVALPAGTDIYSRVFEACPLAILILLNGRISGINDAGLRLLGTMAAGEVIGRPLFEFIHTDDRASTRVWLDQVLIPASPMQQIEKRIVGLDGSVPMSRPAPHYWNTRPISPCN